MLENCFPPPPVQKFLETPLAGTTVLGLYGRKGFIKIFGVGIFENLFSTKIEINCI